MKKLFTIVPLVFAVLVFFTLSACMTMPAPEAKDLWKYITEENPYEEWSFWPDAKGWVEGQSPHGAWLKNYVNRPALKSSDVPLKDGSIIVKENYSKEKKLAAVTVMYKVKGYNPEAGNWYWVKYSPDGKAAAEGKVKSCIKCHNKAAGNDYIFTHSY